jgi:predicted ATPase
MGTPAYLAPELIDRVRNDHRSDLYSLGILAYQLICRRLPFSATGVADLLYHHAYSTPVIPERVDAPPWLRDIVLRLCAKQPADRYRGANQVIEAINAHAGGSYPIETAITRESYVLSGRFVGRHGELADLSAFAARRLGRQPGAPLAMWVGGPSGVGKSRLVRELRHALQLDRFTFVEGHCFEGAVTEYGAFAEAIAQLAAAVASIGAGRLVDAHIGELVKVAPELARGRTVAPSPALASPDAERRRLLDTVAGFLVDAGRLVPYVLHLNDLQWAPQGTIDILRHVYRRIEVTEREHDRVPIAVVGSYRDDEVPGRPAAAFLDETAAAARTLHLRPLPPQPMQQLLQSMFGLDDIPSTFVARVIDEAAGSPFFLEEVVRALVENGSVFVEDGAWHTASAVGDLEIPASVAATLRRRLEMVTNTAQRRLLQVLAAYKKPITAPLLAAVAGIPADDANEALYELQARHLVASTDSGDAYRTAHDHVRAAAYADLGSGAPSVHLQIARALERVSPDGPRLVSETAHHYWLSEDRAKALEYALLAAEGAVAVYANDEAIEHLGHALALLPSDAADARAQASERLADAHFLAGHYEQAKALLAEIAQREQAPLEQARIGRKLGEILGYHAGTPLAAVDIMWAAAQQLGARRPRSRATFLAATVAALARHFLHQAAAPLLPAVDDARERRRRAELTTIYLRISYLSFFGDPMLTFLPVFRAANLADRLGESAAHCDAYSMTAISLAGLGFARRAARYGRQAIAEARRLGTPWHLANAHSFHGFVLLQTGEWMRAAEHAELGRTGFVACGDHLQLAVSLYTLLEARHASGDLRNGVARGREELAVFERLGLQLIGKGPYTVFGQLLAKSGDPEGITVGREVLARAEHGSDKLSTAFAHVALGDSFLQLGRADEAIDHLERGLAIRDRDRFDVYLVAHGSALLARAYAARAQAGAGLPKEWRRSFERRVSQARAAGRRFPPMRGPARLVRGVAHRLRGQHREAIECFRQAATLARRQGARLWEADAELECGLALLDRDRRSVAGAAALERARSLYHECGARPNEQRTLDAISALVGKT